ncbi:MAG TPA: protein phosphatase 2C domain-containing protein [Mycobacteriales bacterium]|nr:protein phosphatase 2C domain-containing protein [Mycobacteriales bacterium]
MQLSWGFASHRGHVRAANEDAVVCAPPVFAVADGMGGHAGGSIASNVVATSLERLAERADLTAQDVLDALAEADEHLRACGDAEPDLNGMGTTVTGVAIVGEGAVEHWLVFNVGDSRVYRFADHRLEQLTVDHSEVEELIRAGAIDAAGAAKYPRRHVITRSMGAYLPAEVDHWLTPPIVGERLVASSDGLFSELPDERIEALLETAVNAQAAADVLVAAALDSGGRDNVSVVVIDVLSVDDDFPDDPNGVDEDTSPRSSLP